MSASPTGVLAGETPAAVEDLSIVVLPGRVQSSANAIADGIEAERLGFHRLWHSERYSPKETGALFGGIAASTTRIGFSTCAINPLARTPMATAGIFATLQSMFGPRFDLGLGRGVDFWSSIDGIKVATYQEYLEQAHIISALWRGESVAYNGSWGNFSGVVMVDRPEGPPPKLFCVTLGAGPRSARVAVDPAFDGVVTAEGFTPATVHDSVQRIRTECERAGRDPDAYRFCASVTIAPDMSDEETYELAHVRVLLYLLSAVGEMYAKANGWDASLVDRVRNEIKLVSSASSTDHALTRSDAVPLAKRLIPDDLAREACGIGSSQECLKKLFEFRDAGADEVVIYGPHPAHCVKVIDGWRAQKG